jgi:hypothetical protein
MDIIAGIVWRVELDDPVHLRDVKPPSSNVCAE